MNDVTTATEFQSEHSLRQANRSYVLPVESAVRRPQTETSFRHLESGEGTALEESPNQRTHSMNWARDRTD